MQTRAEKYTITGVQTTTPLNLYGDTVAVQVTGAMTATVAVEASVDGTNFTPIALTPAAGGAAVTSFSAAGAWTASVPAYVSVRLNCTAFTSIANPIFLGIGQTGR